MNLKELRARLDRRLRDSAFDGLWTPEDKRFGLNEAVREAALRANLTREDSVPISLTVNNASYAFPTGIFPMQVLRVYLASNPAVALIEYSQRRRSQEGRMRDSGKGPPVYYALDGVIGGQRSIRFDPVPQAVDTAYIDMTRLPKPMVEDDDEPELDPHWHPDLLDWAAYLAYTDQDADGEDHARANRWEASFTAKFGPRLPAAELQRRWTDEPLQIYVE